MSLLWTKIAIVGAETALGTAFSRLCPDVIPYDLSAAPPSLPRDCDLLLFCPDDTFSADLQDACLQSLCRELAATRTSQLHVACFVPATAYAPRGRTLRADAVPSPHSLRDLTALRHALTLQAWCAISRTTILPNVFIHGELYGDDSPNHPLPGHVAASLRLAHAHQPLPLPGLGLQRRTLTHLDDFAAAVAQLLSLSLIPPTIAIPGETFTIIDYLDAIANRFDAPLVPSDNPHSDDLPWGLGDRLIAAAPLKAELPDFRPAHRFRDWLDI